MGIIKVDTSITDVETLQMRYAILESYCDELENYIKNLNTTGWHCQLEILDTDNGTSHIVGTNVHDVLYVENGVVYYSNLQNGEGSKYGTYKFVEKADI